MSVHGHVEAVRVLLEHGVDVNARDAHNATPTHLASGSSYKTREERLDVVRLLLLQYGSDIHALDDEGHTPFMKATKNETTHYAVTVGERSGGSQKVIMTDGLGTLCRQRTIVMMFIGMDVTPDIVRRNAHRRRRTGNSFYHIEP
jgi:hypothetical protein